MHADIRYIFGTGFDSHHKAQEDWDLHLEHFGEFADHDLADRANRLKHEKNVREYLKKKRHSDIRKDGPKPFAHVGMY